MKILLIEDDRWYADSLRQLLANHQLQLADSPSTALEAINQDLPEILLLDFQLGPANALNLLNELQSYPDTRALPVIILATDGHRLPLADFQKYGVRAILDKATVTPAEIEQELSNV
jgi:DNA-binding NarL/FixJ family response regulator